MRERLRYARAHEGAVWFCQPRGVTWPAHRHTEVELNLLVAGRLTYLVGDRRCELRRGDLMFLFPGQEHVIVEASGTMAMWVSVIRAAALRKIVTRPDSEARVLLRRDPGPNFSRHLAFATFEALETLLRSVAASGDDADLFNAGLRYAWLRGWEAFSRSPEGPPLAEVHPAVERAARLVRDAPELGLAELARAGGLSASRLSRLFKAQTGTALTRHRTRVKLERFRRIYDRGQRHTMLSAALEAGFESYRQFHRSFREEMGCGPREFLRE